MIKDSNDFLDLLKPYYNYALKYCRALSRKGDTDEAEDLMQHSLLKAFENFSSLKDSKKFKFWFFTIITNEYCSAVRRKLYNKFIFVNDESDIPSMPKLYRNTSNSDLSEILLLALSKLKPKEKAAILLFELAGFSLDEIMVIQKEKSLSCIKLRLSRSREKLRKYITKLESGFNINPKRDVDSGGGLVNETINLLSEVKTGRNGM